ncbi:tRNA (cytosine(34)-C(5))-methyltransferase-like protein, partial [Leptotrombidium deliense]
ESVNLKKGVVIANDVDNRRCYMLVHQSKRLHSPSFVIVNHDAGNIPNFHREVDGVKTKVKFDRILCDAPCSGDGTIRKNYDVWVKWSVANGNNFHGIQTRIAKRSLELLAKDGIMVYSTCSMNPMENESVIASLLNMSEGGLELINVEENVKGLQYIPGLKHWKVMQGNMKVVNSLDDVEKGFTTQIREPLFPPKNVDDLNLDRCIRILPHHQDTGAFFVAAIRKKVDSMPWEKSEIANGNEKTVPPKKKLKGFKEDPFFFFDGSEDEWLKIKEFYKISDQFPANQLMHRSENGKKRNIYFMTEAAKNIIIQNQGIRFINGGVRLFSRIDDKVCGCSYRITQDGLNCLFPYLNPESIVELDIAELELIMMNESVLNEKLRVETQEKLSTLPSGCCVLIHRRIISTENGEQEMLLPFCGWKGKTTLRPYIMRTERMHFLRLCGFETESLEEKERKRFMERQEKRLQRQNQREDEEKNDNEANEVNEDCDTSVLTAS